MTIQEIYNLAIETGIKADLRGRERVEKNLARLKEKYEKMDAKAKADFDQERLKNPYSDTRINFDSGKEIKKILTGIDMEAGELLLADKIGNIDLVLAHHPLGNALASLDDVMHMQEEILEIYGVPINVAQGLLKEKIEEISRKFSTNNLYKEIDVAKILNISLMNVHTPADNLVADFLKKEIESKNPEYIEDILKILNEITEYKEAQKRGTGPSIFSGRPDNRCGKIAFSELTGGTEGTPKIYEKMAIAGIGTIISMHQSEEHKKEAEAANINVVIAGHISSDSLGMNLFLDELEKKGIEIVSCSGLIRVSRAKE
ncbi:MAG: NGG1p interacting factor NIF3 [Patescibacteria group bacterium]